MAELVIKKSIAIHAPAAKVWQVLTDNAYIPQYMFGCMAESDWQPGSPLLWKGAADGKLYVKGKVVSIDAPHALAYTVIDPNSDIADIPENYLTMTYTLTEDGAGVTTFEILQGDYSTVANGQKRYEDSQGGGDFILPAIKKLSEEN